MDGTWITLALRALSFYRSLSLYQGFELRIAMPGLSL